MEVTGLRTDALIEAGAKEAPAIGMLLSHDGDLVGGVADASIVEEVTGAQVHIPPRLTPAVPLTLCLRSWKR